MGEVFFAQGCDAALGINDLEVGEGPASIAFSREFNRLGRGRKEDRVDRLELAGDDDPQRS